MKNKFKKLKENIVLGHASVISSVKDKNDNGASTIEVVAYTLGFLMIASVIVFGMLGITKDQFMTGITSVIDTFFDNVATGS